MKVAIYARFSTENQDASSIEQQVCRFPRTVVIHRPVLTGVDPRRKLNAVGGAR